MRKLFLVFVFAIASACCMAQSISRIQIRHADPQLIFMLLSCTTTFETPPEMSTSVFNFGGGFGNSGFGGGTGGFSSGFGGGQRTN